MARCPLGVVCSEMFDASLHGGDRLCIKVQSLGEFSMGQAQLRARSQSAVGQDLVTCHTPALACSPPFVPVYPPVSNLEGGQISAPLKPETL